MGCLKIKYHSIVIIQTRCLIPNLFGCNAFDLAPWYNASPHRSSALLLLPQTLFIVSVEGMPIFAPVLLHVIAVLVPTFALALLSTFTFALFLISVSMILDHLRPICRV